MIWKGMSQQQAALLLSGFAFFGFVSTLLFGWLADSMNKPRLVSCILFTASVSILFPLFGSSIGHLWFFILLFTTVEATYPVAWAMVGDIFGRTHFAKIRGYMSVFYVWGSVIGPVLAGAIWDRWQTYEPMLWAVVAMFFLGSFLQPARQTVGAAKKCADSVQGSRGSKDYWKTKNDPRFVQDRL